MKLIIVRHGKTEENKDRRVQSQSHGTLSKEGITENEKLSENLKDIKIDVIYSSDLKRASDTAKQIAKYHPDTLIDFREILRERDYGAHLGKLIDEAWAPGTPRWERDAPQGETLDDLKERVQNLIKELKEKHSEDTVLLVSHAAFINMLISLLLEVEYKGASKQLPKHSSFAIFEVE